MFLNILTAFLIGGALCAVSQLLTDKFSLTPARLLVGLFVLGATLSAVGLYEPIVEFAGAGLSVPLPGFGHLMMQGVMEEVRTKGALGILTGGFSAGAAGLGASVLFSAIASLFARSHQPR